ncbi:hypothetical protein P4S93_13445 [Aneurinibacillus thermoaerophilus]|uniref:Uncharacterized protein n=1 Tax=Aneurinibacillus thermoaerophilus TaxID=143495 RepID=A0A1G7X6K4_ANETH|nr:hypothetical protein [Aneurinibacillus thermoaerophilus]MED0674375.1 hypothetical protein [Aneurinibacillus thermoaerophilus]MED0756928.1 hypothetical protein [Aneurinibacillus thermoaerophilus]MED0761767.1 hypothetical protein [Aneurinibacillus thermoaerophilus]QYY44244.1 hypothetical protein K3F53_08740 [Aneurinibacillus thermoaerophilus]SDG79210.1 hypothetical protein SAMN04489735_10032 [Aneurinibacillus thermoaerophilus]
MGAPTQKEFRNRLRGDIPRLSFYKMVKSEEFAELCRFYEQGMIDYSQLQRYAGQLERLF